MISAKKEIPKFRYIALEAEFCKFLTGVMDIFKEYGELKDHYNIIQMLHVLKIEEWRDIVPFAYYLHPLNDSINTTRKTLLKMEDEGPLLRKYIIEQNETLMKQTQDMVKMDLKAQWLVGDELKQDQFKFFYETTKIIYDSAL